MSTATVTAALTTLPTKMSEESREALELAGVTFGEQSPKDKLSTYAKLPAGWQKFKTDYSEWLILLDEKGRVRATLFYSTDGQTSRLNVQRRFNVSYTECDGRWFGELKVIGVVTNGMGVVYRTQLFYYYPQNHHTSRGITRLIAKAAAEAWLDQEHPLWRDPSAYWD
jgi:hypothetical protein